jgi:predicted TIM-barrel fold metal-dependent hydrolase
MLIDTDSHVTEPASLWSDRMSKKRWGDLIPAVKTDPDGRREGWYIGGSRFADLGFSTIFRGRDDTPVRMPGRLDESRGVGTRAYYPVRFAEMHSSSWDPVERSNLMDRWGISAACVYPNLLLFNSRVLDSVGADAIQFTNDATSAYNDFVIDFASEAPGRYIPLACVPFWDLAASVKEIERCAGMGHRGLIMSGYPQLHGQPYLADLFWEPLWAAAEAAGLPIHFHVGSGDISSHAANAERVAAEGSALSSVRAVSEILIDNAFCVCDLLTSGILPRHPGLKFVSVESGVGWIPFLLEALDSHFERYGIREMRRDFKMKPSEYFKEHILTTVWFEELSSFHIDRVGVENIMFETDYPHITCLMGDEVWASADRCLAELSQADRERILWRNAAELYGVEVNDPTSE